MPHIVIDPRGVRPIRLDRNEAKALLDDEVAGGQPGRTQPGAFPVLGRLRIVAAKLLILTSACRARDPKASIGARASGALHRNT
jgi:hypothetical protein